MQPSCLAHSRRVGLVGWLHGIENPVGKAGVCMKEQPLSLAAMCELRSRIVELLRKVERRSRKSEGEDDHGLRMQELRFVTGIWVGIEWCANPNGEAARLWEQQFGESINGGPLNIQDDVFKNILKRLGGRPGGDS